MTLDELILQAEGLRAKYGGRTQVACWPRCREDQPIWDDFTINELMVKSRVQVRNLDRQRDGEIKTVVMLEVK